MSLCELCRIPSLWIRHSRLVQGSPGCLREGEGERERGGGGEREIGKGSVL